MRYEAGRARTCAFSHGANRGPREVLSPLPGQGPQQAPKSSRQAPPLKGPTLSTLGNQASSTGALGRDYSRPQQCVSGVPLLSRVVRFDLSLSKLSGGTSSSPLLLSGLLRPRAWLLGALLPGVWVPRGFLLDLQ